MNVSVVKNLFWLNENIFCWIQICFDLMKIYFDIMKRKGDIMKICFIKYKVILIEWKYIFISSEFLFLQHFSTIYNLIGVHFWGVLQPVGHVVGQKDKCRPIRTQEIAVVRLYKKLFDKNRIFLGQLQHAYDFSNLRHILIKICIK